MALLRFTPLESKEPQQCKMRYVALCYLNKTGLVIMVVPSSKHPSPMTMPLTAEETGSRLAK